MKQARVNAVEMVRTIRDAIYEETKSFSREELKEYFAHESSAFRRRSMKVPGSRSGILPSSSPRLGPGVRFDPPHPRVPMGCSIQVLYGHPQGGGLSTAQRSW